MGQGFIYAVVSLMMEVMINIYWGHPIRQTSRVLGRRRRSST